MGWFSVRRFARVAGIAFAVWSVVMVGVFLALQWTIHQQRTDPLNAFTGMSFAADYTLKPDGSMDVVETVTLNFPPKTNHGINRDLPTTYRERYLFPGDFSVTDAAGGHVPVDEIPQEDFKRLRIGDPSAYVEGLTTYKISYTYENVVQDFGDVQEFFWDVNGDQWFQNFPQVSATIHLPSELASKRTGQLRCFGGNNDACQIIEQRTDAGTVISASARNVDARSTMTVSVPFDLGTVRDGGPASSFGSVMNRLLTILFACAALLLLAMAFGNVTRPRRLMRGSPVVPEFVPPHGLSPAGAAEVCGTPERSIPAQLLQAVIEGRIRLTSGPAGDIKAQILDASTQSTDGIGSTALSVIIGNHKAGGEPYSLAQRFKGPQAKVRYTNGRKRYLTRKDSPVQGPPPWVGRLLDGAVIMGSILLFMFAARASLSIWWTPVWLLMCAAGYGLFAAWVRVKDVEVFAHLEGMREYIGRTDADRLAVLQSAQTADRVGPEQEIQIYEKLLPWAVALGVEETWRKQIGAERLAGLDWYDDSVGSVSSSGSSFRSSSSAAAAAAVGASAGFGAFSAGSGGGGGGGGSSSGGSFGGGSGGGGGGGGGSGW